MEGTLVLSLLLLLLRLVTSFVYYYFFVIKFQFLSAAVKFYSIDQTLD
jgi:hypothetical protein